MCLPHRLGYQGIPDIIGGERIDRYGNIEGVIAAAETYVGEQRILDSNPVERYGLQITRENCITARHWLGQQIPRQDAVIVGQVRSSHERRLERLIVMADKADAMRDEFRQIGKRNKWWLNR